MAAPEPTEAELLLAAIRRQLERVHTCFPAKVKSYVAATGKAVLEPCVQPDDEAWPDLLDVPVVWPRGGGYILHLPLTAGDWVWVHCAESDFSAWAATGSKAETASDRRHGLNCFAVPGAFPDSAPPGVPVAASGAFIGKGSVGLHWAASALEVGAVPNTGGNVARADLIASALTPLSATVCAGSGAPCPLAAALISALSAAAIQAQKLKSE